MTLQGFFGAVWSCRNICGGVTSSNIVQFCQTNSDVAPCSADKSVFSSWLAPCSPDGLCSDSSLLSFPVADYRLGVSCLKSLIFSVSDMFLLNRSLLLPTPPPTPPWVLALSLGIPTLPWDRKNEVSAHPGWIMPLFAGRTASIPDTAREGERPKGGYCSTPAEELNRETCARRAPTLAFLHSKPSEAEKTERGREARRGYAAFPVGMLAGPW